MEGKDSVGALFMYFAGLSHSFQIQWIRNKSGPGGSNSTWKDS